MAKRDIVRPIASITAAVSAWTELSREFKLGDASCGEVGLINTIGRLSLKMTASILAYTLTDCCFEWLFNAKDKVLTEVHATNEKTQDAVEDTESEKPFDVEDAVEDTEDEPYGEASEKPFEVEEEVEDE